MTGTVPSEYRDLALDSSNEMMEYDSRWVLGRYPEAAWHILRAGIARVRMGQMMFDTGEFVLAAEDWLSAAACFYLATDLERMRDAFERVRELDREGKIPPERRDIHAAIKEREEKIKVLEGKLSQFQRDYHNRVGPAHVASQESLNWLLRQVRELPGWTDLHAAIASQAGRLGQKPLAVQHLDWAEKIKPGDPQLEAFRAALWLASPDREQGLEKARELLKAHPEMADLRMYCAMALTSEPKGRDEDWEEAFALLQPLLREDSGDRHARLGAFALAAISRYRAGDDAEYRRLLQTFERLAASTREPTDHDFVARLRRDFPQLFPQPGSDEAARESNRVHEPPAELDYSAVGRGFERFSPLAMSAVA